MTIGIDKKHIAYSKLIYWNIPIKELKETKGIFMIKRLRKYFTEINTSSLISAVVSLALAAFTQVGWAATYYMPDDFENLSIAFSGMSSGDELVIRDGTYIGNNNIINDSQFPPAGINSKYTTIRAEHDGKVYFGDPNSNERTFYVENKGNSYIRFEGLVWYGGCHVGNVNYLKFFRCGSGSNIVTGANLAFSNNVSSYILYEDCYAWGGSRYKFSSYKSDHIIFRRCIGRIDACNTLHSGKSEPIGGVAIYWSSYCEAQNCIIIDSKTSKYWVYESLPGAFTTPNMGGENNNFIGCIGLKLDLSLHGQHSAYKNTNRINCIGWDITRGAIVGGVTHFDHNTIGNISTNDSNVAGINAYNSIADATNSIFVGVSSDIGALYNVVSNNNSFYNNSLNYNHTVAGNKDVHSINPLTNSLLYLPRIESNSDLSGIASDNGDVGATVMKRIGVSGTLWGENGYKDTTEVPLWPWPNENIIKMNMRTYNHPQISGKRGFCSDGKQLNGKDDITLTSYIWEYLGNPIPAGFYGKPGKATWEN